jgi:hypothetical protein
VTEILEVLPERDGLYAIERMETLVDAPDRSQRFAAMANCEAASAFADARLCSLSKLTIICRLFKNL